MFCLILVLTDISLNLEVRILSSKFILYFNCMISNEHFKMRKQFTILKYLKLSLKSQYKKIGVIHLIIFLLLN